MEGWILIHRSILDNWAYFAGPFDKAHAWIDLLLLPNHQKHSIWIRGIEVTIQRGQLAYSKLTLMNRWRWSNKKLESFLLALKKEGQITYQNSNVTTIISITNYDKYQFTTDQTTDQKQNKLPTKLPTDKECLNNDQKIINISSEKILFSDPPSLKSEKTNKFSHSLSSYFGSMHGKHLDKVIYQLISMGYSIEKIKEAVQNGKSNPATKNKFLSPGKLLHKDKSNENQLFIETFLALKNKKNQINTATGGRQ